MRAVALDFAARALEERAVREPAVLGPHEVLFRVEEVGICGTDRELVAFLLGEPPPGESHLILGHEAVGTVVETGSAVTGLQPGDLVAPMIRRPCSPACRSCARGRADLCLTGRFAERGIFRRHGYLTDYAVDEEQYLVRVPPALAEVAVLAEPLSVVEKAIATALRLREEPPASALVLGAGPIGVLAALALLSRSVAVTVYSLEPPDHPRARLVERAGAGYMTVLAGKFDLVIEATGSPAAALAAIHSLGPLGVCVILGAKSAGGPIPLLDLIVGNQIVFGSVNSSPASFAQAIHDLARFDPAVTASLIHRAGFADFRRTLTEPVPSVSKWVHVLSSPL